MSPPLRDGLTTAGVRYVLDVRPDMTVWPLEPTWTKPPYQGNGRPRKPRPSRDERQTMVQRSLALPEEAWREITVAAGSQGPRTYRYSAQRVRVTQRRQPGEILWAVYRRNRDGSEPRYYLSNAPGDTPLETLAYVGGHHIAVLPSVQLRLRTGTAGRLPYRKTGSRGRSRVRRPSGTERAAVRQGSPSRQQGPGLPVTDPRRFCGEHCWAGVVPGKTGRCLPAAGDAKLGGRHRAGRHAERILALRPEQGRLPRTGRPGAERLLRCPLRNVAETAPAGGRGVP